MSVIRAHDYLGQGPLRLVDIRELSRILSIPIGTLYNWTYLRRIPFMKAGRSLRFDPLEVVASLPRYAKSKEPGA